MVTINESDEGEKGLQDDTLGQGVDVEYGIPYVDPASGIRDTLFPGLGWADEDGNAGSAKGGSH